MSSTARSLEPVDSDFGCADHFRHPATGVRYAKVLPGELFGTRENLLIVTLLGSCVAACIRDPEAGIGGLNHFMLPGGSTDTNDPTGNHRYGQSAMDTLIRCLLSNGAKSERLEIKLFGGGNMLERGAGDSIGASNVQFVEEYCQAAGLMVRARDLGKHCPRKIHYNPLDGSVLVKRLAPLYRNIVAKQNNAD